MFKKRYILLLLIIVLTLIFVCTYSLHGTYNDVLWMYRVPLNEEIKYLNKNESFVLLTSKLKSNDKYYLRLFDKRNYKLKGTIKLKEPINKPELLKDFIVISTNNSPGKNNYIYVFMANTSHLLWKKPYSKGLWDFITEHDAIYFVDYSGSIRKLGLIDREPIWRVISQNNFFNSTEPVISGNKFYICNDELVISLDKNTSKIEYNYKIPSKAIDCKFSGDLASILSVDEDIYVLNLSNSKVLWKYKHILLFSKAFIEILDNSFLVLLNTVDFSEIKKTKRSKLLTRKNQVLTLFDLFSGTSKWQKGLKYPINEINQRLLDNNVIMLQTTDGHLTAYKLENGKKLWSFYGIDSKTPRINYTVKDDKVYFVVDEIKDSSLFVLSLKKGTLINKIKIPKCKKDNINAIIDDDKIFLTCKGNYIEAVKLPPAKNKNKKE